jgi:hypothetical protein
MEHKPKKLNIFKVTNGVDMSARSGKTWLHFEANNGQKCSFCIEDKFPSICAATIKQWALDMAAGRMI